MNNAKLMLAMLANQQLIDALEKVATNFEGNENLFSEIKILVEKWRQYKSLIND